MSASPDLVAASANLVARLERSAKSDSLPVSKLPDEQKKLVKEIGLKPPKTAVQSMGGYVVDFGGVPGNRFDKALLHKLVASSVFRWIEVRHDGGVSVGM